MKKLHLKKVYKNILRNILIILLLSIIILGVFILYQDRYKKVGDQRPTSANIKDLFSK